MWNLILDTFMAIYEKRNLILLCNFFCVCAFFPPFQLFPKRKRFDFIQLPTFYHTIYRFVCLLHVFVCDATSNDRTTHNHSAYVTTFGTRNNFGMWSKKSVINFIHFSHPFVLLFRIEKYAHNDVNYVNWHDIRYERELLMYNMMQILDVFVVLFEFEDALKRTHFTHSSLCLYVCTTLIDEYN